MPRSPASSNHEPPEQPPPQPQPRWEPEKAERRRPREEEEEEQEEEEEEEEEGDEAATEEEEEEEEAEAADGAEQPPLAAPCLLNGQPGGESREGSPKDEAPLYETIKPPAAAGSAPPASPPGRMDQPAPHALVVRIGIPDLQQTKCLRLNPDVPIWVSKQQILCTLNHSLKDVLNYGLFQPAFNGRAGKFLDEERLLREYPLNPDTPVPYLEFRYKRRVYTQSLLDDKQFAKLHTKVSKYLREVPLMCFGRVYKLPLLCSGNETGTEQTGSAAGCEWGPLWKGSSSLLRRGTASQRQGAAGLEQRLRYHHHHHHHHHPPAVYDPSIGKGATLGVKGGGRLVDRGTSLLSCGVCCIHAWAGAQHTFYVLSSLTPKPEELKALGSEDGKDPCRSPQRGASSLSRPLGL
ncbi:uncharacterized protein LOC125434606 [Sphaerodactylus townsendi]|uniref:uncharacterized protein LOC125434606 n=1 Tax=Sphaerodactylus townsendi TaxID=933632 RepID=UPI0020266B4E|nr:uncharacterized protein LOC125434606 [Sphaerodactylus townsendi]